MDAIVAKKQVKPENKGAYIEAALKLVEASRLEKGCLYYDLFEDRADPFTLVFVELWSDMDSIKSHNASKHFRELVPVLDSLTENKTVSTYRRLN